MKPRLKALPATEEDKDVWRHFYGRRVRTGGAFEHPVRPEPKRRWARALA